MTARGADEEPGAAKQNQGWEWKQNQGPQREQRQGQPAPPPEPNRAQNPERNREPRPWQRPEQEGNRDGSRDTDMDRDKDREQHRERPKGPLVRECSPPYRRRSGQIAAVVLYGNGGHSVVWPGRRENHQRTWLLSRAYTVFEVLLGRNVTEFDLRLPACGDGIFFDASAKVHWEVTDPYVVVTQRVWDVAELLHDELLDGLRAVSRRFALTDAQRADEAVREELRAGRLALGHDLGLRTWVHVFIDLNTLVQQNVQKQYEDAAERRLVAERAREVEILLRRGEEAEIAHHMAQNPDKQWEIRRAIRQEKRDGQADFLAVFNRLIDSGVLERHDIGEPMYEVLQFLRESTGGVLGGVVDHVLPRSGVQRPALEERAVRPEPQRPFWDEEEPSGIGPGYGSRDGFGSRDGSGSGSPDGSPDGSGVGSGDPYVYEPTRVESAAERDLDERRRSRRSPSRPSEAFDDWDDE
ncbi:regulator of protease activity HflC (stomatin/prohibitin superfamily) [Streptomyces sp. SLBN-118]|uniref:hypothetical protein n=1 Tax=Streptomyces sp. SLBN-118 TaxID=2768454 RepID=UPI001153C2A2|nr:hypothetical protein [Streptomyces sp. SLBN-118]TQK51324.1 regulator of protease activity HflC (stomatin/prohibitin superfamily) [Streptomyces sp. SLBN-118]